MSEERAILADRLLELGLAQVGSHAVILIDPDGVIVGWLGGAERVFGYRADEIIGRKLSDLFTPEDVEKGLSSWGRTAWIPARVHHSLNSATYSCASPMPSRAVRQAQAKARQGTGAKEYTNETMGLRNQLSSRPG